MNDYVQEYIEAVESGRIIVGNKIQKAIDRHKRDLIKSQSEDYPYEFDLEKTRCLLSLLDRYQTLKVAKLTEWHSFRSLLSSLSLVG